MKPRENILLVLDQYAAAEKLSDDGLSMGTDYCVKNLLEAIDWSKMPAPKIREIFAFIVILAIP